MNGQQIVSVIVFPKNTMFLGSKWMPAAELVTASYAAANWAKDDATMGAQDRVKAIVGAVYATEKNDVLKRFAHMVGEEFAR